jgi:hypothetical protein
LKKEQEDKLAGIAYEICKSRNIALATGNLE